MLKTILLGAALAAAAGLTAATDVLPATEMAPADTVRPTSYSPFPGALVVQVAKAKSAAGEWACEPAVALDPNEPYRAAVGTVLNRVHTSTTMGATWESQTLTSPLGVYGDPVLAYSPDGRLYYFHLSDSEGKGWKSPGHLDRMVVQWSDNHGQSWSSGVGIGYNPPKDQDKEWVYIDPRNGSLHLTWTEFDAYGSKKASDRSRIRYAQSTDRGATWSKPVTLSLLEGDCLDDDGTTEGAVPAMDGMGRLHVVWSRGGKLWYNRSDNAGATWLPKERSIGTQLGGWTFPIPTLGRANGLPFTVSRGNQDVLTMYGTSQREVARLWILASRDQGEHWQDPIEFRPDPGCVNAFFGAFAVDPSTKNLHAVSYAQQADLSLVTYYSRSTDGGHTWSHLPIQKTGFQAKPGVFFGDYNHIAAHKGVVYAVWTEQHQGVNSVWCISLNEQELFGDSPSR